MDFCPHCMRPVAGENNAFCSECGGDLRWTGAENHLPVGTVLTGSGGLRTYQVGAARGQGGFGITYIARERGSQKRVAIKEFYPSRCAYRGGDKATVLTMTGQNDTFQSGMKSFLEEARMLATHDDLPTVVRVIDYFQANNTAYLVMEYIDGVPLHEKMNQMGGRLPAQDFIPKLPPLLRDLGRLHQTGVIHRDISPDNLIWMPDGSLKLLDFGAARSMDGEKSMTVLLKHGFAPIEQYRTHGQGPFTDVYALAATIYYCITGQVPPPAMDRMEGDTLQSPVALGAKLTVQQETALLWALSVQPHARPQTMEQFAQMLFAPASAQAPNPGPTPPPPPPPGPVSPTNNTGTTTGTGIGQTQHMGSGYNQPVTPQDNGPAQNSGPKKPLLIGVIALLVVIIGVGIGVIIHFVNQDSGSTVSRNPSSSSVAPKPTPTPDLTPTPEPSASVVKNDDGYVFEIVDRNHAAITGYEGTDSILYIPGEIDGVPVTAIASNALAGVKVNDLISLPTSLESIGPNAFRNCSSLRAIVVNSSVTTDNTSFSGCDNLRAVAVSQASFQTTGWSGLPRGCRLYHPGMDIGIGALVDIDFGDSYEIYGWNSDGESVLLDVPAGLSQLFIPDNVNGKTVIWVHSNALDYASRGMNIKLGSDTLYDYSLQSSANWSAPSNSQAEAWVYTCKLADAVNEKRASMSAPPMRPDVTAMNAARIRAAELVQVYDANRPDGREWSTAYTEAGGDWKYLNGVRGHNYSSLYGESGLVQKTCTYVAEHYAPALTAEESSIHAGEYRNYIGGAYAYDGENYVWFSFVSLN